MHRQTATLFAALISALVMTSSAEALTYKNERYGTSASFPGDLFPNELPAPVEGDGLGWSAGNGAEIYVYGRRKEPGESPRSIIEARSAADDVTYKASGRNWAVVSGYRDGRIFYERYILRGDLVHSVAIRYPKEVRSIYDPVVGKITNSLRGPSSPAKG